MAKKWYRLSVFGRTVVINAHAKRGVRLSPGASPRAVAIGKCAKGKDLPTRKSCFKSGG